MGKMEKSIQKNDKIWFDIDSILIRFDLIWKWKFLKKYQFKTDIDIIFIFKLDWY